MNSNKVFANETYLLERFALSDEMAFEYIFHKYYARLCLYASNICNSKILAEDIAKEAFMKIWKGEKIFKSLDHLKNSLYQSTRQLALNKLLSLKRSLKREEDYYSDLPQHEESPLHRIIHAEVMGELYDAINKLPDKAKKVIILSYLEGKSNQEIADELQINLQTVKNYKLRAIKHLRSSLKPESFIIFISALYLIEKNHF